MIAQMDQTGKNLRRILRERIRIRGGGIRCLQAYLPQNDTRGGWTAQVILGEEPFAVCLGKVKKRSPIMLPNPQMHYDLFKARQRELLQAAELARLAQAARAERPQRAALPVRRVSSLLVTAVLWLKTLW
jgi:hypothetical protein